MYQSTDLNRSSLPVRRGQDQPGPLVLASDDQIANLQEQIDLKADASAVDDIPTALAAAVARIAALEEANTSILARLDALEAP